MRDTELSGLCGTVTHNFNESDFISRTRTKKMVKTRLKQCPNAVPSSAPEAYDSIINGRRLAANSAKLGTSVCLTSLSGD